MTWVMMHTEPLAYFITFRPYGTWLPGDARGWMVRGGAEPCEGAPTVAARAAQRLRYPVVRLSPAWRDVVRAAVVETCAHRGWPVHALVVEPEHLHVVVSAAGVAPEKVLMDLKAWATRGLRARGHLRDHPHPWAEHGSTRYLFDPESVQRAVSYVLDAHHSDARGR